MLETKLMKTNPDVQWYQKVGSLPCLSTHMYVFVRRPVHIKESGPDTGRSISTVCTAQIRLHITHLHCICFRLYRMFQWR